MFARVLTLHVRLEKKAELANKVLQEGVPIIKRSASPVEIFVLQDETDLDQLVVVSLWESKQDADRYQAASYEKVKAVLQPYLTFPPVLRTYKVDDTAPWNLLTAQSGASLLSKPKRPQLRIVSSRRIPEANA
jgi:heme-degrading monooxygenase HmoA